jgi:oligopeptide/dipeptide ABC transporter ATP-binding protein
MTSPLLVVDDLHVHFIARDPYDRVRVARALNGVSFSVARGEILGIVGETGAGKSLTASAIMGMIRPPGRRVAGKITFDGEDITALDEDGLRALRGSRMSLVVQSPRTSLDPLERIGAQIARVHRAHKPATARDAMDRAIAMLRSVGIADARRANAWPHELSGGMAQRVLIAMALVNEPDLLIADEPTTGLDVTVQAQILELFRTKVRERNAASLIITHDLGVVAQFCERVAVMFAGSIVEYGRVEDVFANPRHPYTVQLIGSAPDRALSGGNKLQAGAPPDLYDLPKGCVYQLRCPRRLADCAAPILATAASADHRFYCLNPVPQ